MKFGLFNDGSDEVDLVNHFQNLQTPSKTTKEWNDQEDILPMANLEDAWMATQGLVDDDDGMKLNLEMIPDQMAEQLSPPKLKLQKIEELEVPESPQIKLERIGDHGSPMFKLEKVDCGSPEFKL